MSTTTKIAWTEATWSPVTGCTPISAGCQNCYAKRMATRLKGRCGYPADEPFRVTLHPERLEEPMQWQKPRRVFVCSMGDLFHEEVPFGWPTHVFDTARECQQHTFQVLTKRPQRLLAFLRGEPLDTGWRYGSAPENVWLGTSCENQQAADKRLPHLLQCPANVRFLSCEPLLGPIDLARWLPRQRYYMARCDKCGFSGSSELWREIRYHDDADCECPECSSRNLTALNSSIAWAIVGCESGPKRRPCKLDWVCSIVQQCKAAGVPVFVKQLDIDGNVSHEPEQWPADLRVREYPVAN